MKVSADDSFSGLQSNESIAVWRWQAYLNERFPVLAHGLLIASFYSSNQFLAHALRDPGAPMEYNLSSLLGFVVLFCLFLHLRLLDDCKDYEDDCRYFPDRVLQRGVVTRRELTFVCAAAIMIELLLGAIFDLAALVSIFIAICFSFLMFREFFARSWLKRHFLVYASTHMLIIPLMTLIVFSFATRGYFWQVPGWFWLYSLVGFFVGFNWEISRKIRSPEQEIDGVDTYTKRFGTFGAAYLVLVIRALDTGLVALVGYHLHASKSFYVAIVVLYLICLIGFFQYRFWTCPRTAKRMATYAGMYIVAFDLVLAIELGRKYGVCFSGSM